MSNIKPRRQHITGTIDNSQKNAMLGSDGDADPCHKQEKPLWNEVYESLYILIPIYLVVLFIALYDHSDLAGWYWLHNYRKPSYSTGSLSSLSINPFLSSISDYSFNAMEIFADRLPADKMFDSFQHLAKPNRIVQAMKSNIDITIHEPRSNDLTTDSWLKWSVHGKALNIPESFEPSVASDDERLKRQFMLDVQLNGYSLNIPNAQVFDYRLNGMVSDRINH
jgi:hypothetical protein